MNIYKIKYDTFTFIIQANTSKEAIVVSKELLIEKCKNNIKETEKILEAASIYHNLNSTSAISSLKQNIDVNNKIMNEDIPSVYLIGKIDN